MPHVTPVPHGVAVVTPRLFCRDPVAEIEFCVAVFGAAELNRRPGPDGRVAHALITIGSSMLMIEGEWPGVRSKAPALDGSSSVVIYLYVTDVDRVVECALTHGARMLLPITNQFWGDRTAWIMDPSGHVWTVATRIEEITEEERQARLSQLQAQSSKSPLV